MITNFETITADLSYPEKLATRVLIDTLNDSSKICPISQSALSDHIKNETGLDFSASRIRKMIHYISRKKLTRLPLLANSLGYYISDDQTEIARYLKSITDRIEAIEVRRYSIQNWNIQPSL